MTKKRDGPLTSSRINNGDVLQKMAAKKYPLALRQLGRGGTVVALLLVRTDGRVGETVIENSSGYPDIDSTTVELLKSAEIEPLRIGGQPADSWQLISSTGAPVGNLGIPFTT